MGAGGYLERILTARVYEVARETPLERAPGLSRRLGCEVLLKREDLQPVFSFKLRGAYNRIARLPPEQARHGVVAASAGNHAQGVALAARRLGLRATIVMPRTTPSIKVEAVRRLGARALLHGDTYDEAAAHAVALARSAGAAFIHPYDDPDVIAGQGTIGMEILRQHPGPLDAVFVPVGGGGLIAGIAAYVKHLRPEVRIVGVEPEDAPTLTRALERGRRVRLPQVGIFADGVAVRQVGREPFRIARRTVDEMVLVGVDEICAAIKDVFEDTRSVPEPAGAVAVAGLKRWVHERGVRDAVLVAIESGANINFDRLRYVAERTELGEGHEALLAVTIPERPGSFLRFCRAIGRRAITEFNYRYADPAEAHVFVGLRIADRDEREALVGHLRGEGYPVVDLSDDEVAKLHVRHMVGGRAPQVRDEVLYRVEFPERPGALMEFLGRMGGRWNISLFHYRNHGDAYGRVLMGVQVPPGERRAFRDFLAGLGLPFWDESDNPAYALFAAAG
ncbi:threonine ammonia-lyase, biosynthetic [Inmirania thermothiophila]|uniref:L-threonine dehydratase n=1 Tax=Inmirania thermothiophila TaxID=1750597 RepID=A0A3N1Y7D7_9GAMM|nr:threonine ammonia-lyase, biosynthetic [Inmirania thermothiophila]ROR34723.1 threonine dehydratase [Inmirania thermothiophila]